jgi:hypothetical protein
VESGTLVVVLARVETGVTPDYETVGHTTCPECEHMVWVDPKSYERMMANEDIWPICLTCAEAHAAKNPEAWESQEPD